MAKVRIEVDRERCKGCELCVVFCPLHNLEVGDQPNESGHYPVLVKDEGVCSGCGLCAVMCPDVAITISVEEPVVE